MDDSFEYSWTEPELRRAWLSYICATFLKPLPLARLFLAGCIVWCIGYGLGALLTPPHPGCGIYTDAANSGAIIAILIAAGLGLGSLGQYRNSWCDDMEAIGPLKLTLGEDGLHCHTGDGGAVFVPWSAAAILEDKPHYFWLKRGLIGSWILPGSLPESIKQTMRVAYAKGA